MKDKIRVIIPDSHGEHIDRKARDACLRDIAKLCPQEIVWLGDHLDAGGVFSTHQRAYSKELTESYADDVEAANRFLDLVQKAAPGAENHYLFGNHEDHVERWAAREFTSRKDADFVSERIGPVSALRLKERKFKVYRSSEMYHGLSVPGVIKLGKCFFTHGMSASKHAANTHLSYVGGNIVFGHVHRSLAVVEKTVVSSSIGAWCPGTLARLQPLYHHTRPSNWTHGYGVQFVARSGKFFHLNVPIIDGKSFLMAVVDGVKGK